MSQVTTNASAAANQPHEFLRFTLNQRAQHWLLILSFVMLVVTGMPLRYPGNPVAAKAVMLMGGIGARSIIHRCGALLLIGLCIYHVAYILFSEKGSRDFRAMFFQWRDLTDMIAMMKFYFGLGKSKPRFGRFSYQEKFEYYAVGWGSVVMIGTGLLLWFPEAASGFFPKWALDVARIVHSWEGLLAILAIIISHMYTVHLNPDIFPMSSIWLTGRIREEELQRHHPLEYEEIMLHSKDNV